MQLLIIKSQKVRLSLLDLVQHFLTKFLGGLNFFSLLLIDGVILELYLVF